MRLLSRIALALGLTLFVLAAVAVTVFAIGTPIRPQASASAASPEPEPSGPLAMEIPGCVCHSDDPQVVAEHATYRMSECFDCHADGMPEMGP